MNRKKTLLEPIVSSSNFKKNVSYVNFIVANKIFETGITQKVIADLSTIQHFITNHDLIHNYYDNYLKYQTRSKEILPFYKKNTLLLPLNNSFLKLTNI